MNDAEVLAHSLLLGDYVLFCVWGTKGLMTAAEGPQQLDDLLWVSPWFVIPNAGKDECH